MERFKVDTRLEPAKTGAAALDSFAASIVNGLNDVASNTNEPSKTVVARQLVKIFNDRFYSSNPSAFGPYFRSMYQTFKHISESSLSDDEKKRFANIARGQVSEGAVFLLALNGLTELGFAFIVYIEEFGLLEHMHRGYMARFKGPLLEGYHERAFLGSKERNQHPASATRKRRPDFFVREIQEPIVAGGEPANPELDQRGE